MNDESQVSDVTSVLLEIRESIERLDAAEELAEKHLREAELAKMAMRLREELESDVREGSVESLLRAKEKLNQILDQMIEAALAHS
jgi:hypothetical protein